jgi:hypothetical protein
MSTSTFDPSRVLVSYHGVPISGFADGTFISAERDTESFSKTVGADGEVARVANADKSGKVKLTLLQTSQGNDVLSAMLKIDELTKHAIGPVFIKDLFGTTLVGGAEAWLEKPATVVLGKEIEGREWTVVVADMEIFVGGDL